MMVELYSTDCPKCKVLKRLLEEASISYYLYENEDTEGQMINLGFMEAPMLVVDGKAKNFSEAVEWIRSTK